MIFISCSKDEDSEIILSEQAEIYKAFWMDYNLHYAGFILNPVDWDSVYRANIKLVNENTSDKELFEILKATVYDLKDGHISIYASGVGYYSYYEEFLITKPKNYLGWSVIENNFIEDSVFGNYVLKYGKIRDKNIGYLCINTFNENEPPYHVIDEFIKKFQNADGIIIDVRDNGGGNEMNGWTIASRFTESRVTYRYARLKTGPLRGNLGNFLPLSYKPAGEIKFLGNVVLLTNRTTYSAAEDFTLMMKALPQVTHMGDTTWGGASTGPKAETLANGWKYWVPEKINYNLNKIPIMGGIAPDVSIEISTEDSLAGYDRILDEAIQLIEN